MKKLLTVLCAALAFLAVPPVLAGPGPSNLTYEIPSPLLNGQTLEAARGFYIVPPSGGFGLLTLELNAYDANDSVTDLTLACYTRIPAPVTKFTAVTTAQCGIDVLTIQQDGATCTLTEATDWTKGATDLTARTALAAAAISKCGAKSLRGAADVEIFPGEGKSSIWIYTSDATCAGAQNVAAKGTQLQSCTVASGVCASSKASWDMGSASVGPLADTDDWKMAAWRIDVEGFNHIYCVVTPTGGGSADLIYAYGRFSVK